MATRLKTAAEEIRRHFDSGEQVLTLSQLQQTLKENRMTWNLPLRLSQAKFIEFLEEEGDLETVRLPFPHRSILRYTWAHPPLTSVVQSINKDGYFSHFTAIQHHSLTEQLPKTIFFNVEQSLTGGGTEPSQDGINRAFARKCRVSKNLVVYNDWTIRCLSGRNTGQMGVVESSGENDTRLRYTNLERTLIDSTVRPIYSGGPFQVAEAFEAAQPKVNIHLLVDYLRKLNYTYPYHQCIGYYMRRAGNYTEDQIDLLKSLGIRYDFYLDYALKNTDFNAEWRLHVPQGF